MILCMAFFCYNGLLAGSGFGDVVSVRLNCRVRLRRKLAVDTRDDGSLDYQCLTALATLLQH